MNKNTKIVIANGETYNSRTEMKLIRDMGNDHAMSKGQDLNKTVRLAVMPWQRLAAVAARGNAMGGVR